MSRRRPDRPTADPIEHKETHRMISRPRLFCSLALALFAAAMTPAAASAAPAISATTLIPDHVTPGGGVSFYISVRNAGDEDLSGNMTIKYTFPDGVSVSDPEPDQAPAPSCVQAGQVSECTIDATGTPPDRNLRYQTFSVVDAGASGTLTGQVEISGGGASETIAIPLSLDTDPIGPFEVQSLTAELGDGFHPPVTQAGAVPQQIGTGFEVLSGAINNFGVPLPQFTLVGPPESIRDVIVHVPPGFVGNPNATPLKCTAAQLAQGATETSKKVPICPQDSQIGTLLLNGKDVVPIYNIVPAKGVLAQFGFWYEGVVTTFHPELRPSDHGIDVVSEKAPTAIPVSSLEAILWGVPAASSHDRLRPDCLISTFGNNGSVCPSDAPKEPFLRLPTSCSDAPLPWSIDIDTHQNPGVFHHRDTITSPLEGCEKVPFDPDLALTPSSSAAHSPTGLDVSLELPQEWSPGGVGQADLREVVLALPEGVSVNPAAAEGLEACTDAQLRLGLEGPSDCPPAAKLGSIELSTPLLDERVEGSLYMRSQASNDPRSGEMYRLALELSSEERGLYVKLPGSLKADPNTGQLTSTFSDLPQLPLESMQLHMKAGPRAPLTMPRECGRYVTRATLTGWNDKTVTAEPGFVIDQGCEALGFAPGFEAGSADPTAGAFSPFTLRVTRDSGQPNISRIDATLPEGELAKLAGVAVCADAQAASGECPESSRVGHLVAAVGEGPNPLYVPQPGKAPTAVYLAGPHRGAPYSILTEVPAQAGPFDLGTVLVRSAVRIDPVTTRASVTSDPLPQIFAGIPVTYRDVRVQIDRPRFTLNPTDCEPKAVTATIAAATGQSARVSDRFQVNDCAALGFRPRLSLALKGKVNRGAHPRLVATLKARHGDANIARARVKLPPTAFLDQSHIRTICTRPAFAAGSCPPGSVYGRARAISPLLDYPLAGQVYLRSNPAHRLPDLVAHLRGPGVEPIEVELAGGTDSVKGALRNTFEAVPDAPVTSFRLELFGGKRGLIEMTDGLCAKPRATIKLTAQNGRIHNSRPVVKAACAKAPKKSGHRKR
jgi:hypothetical protein